MDWGDIALLYITLSVLCLYIDCRPVVIKVLPCLIAAGIIAIMIREIGGKESVKNAREDDGEDKEKETAANECEAAKETENQQA